MSLICDPTSEDIKNQRTEFEVFLFLFFVLSQDEVSITFLNATAKVMPDRGNRRQTRTKSTAELLVVTRFTQCGLAGRKILDTDTEVAAKQISNATLVFSVSVAHAACTMVSLR